jgi:hypothetical protein
MPDVNPLWESLLCGLKKEINKHQPPVIEPILHTYCLVVHTATFVIFRNSTTHALSSKG